MQEYLSSVALTKGLIEYIFLEYIQHAFSVRVLQTNIFRKILVTINRLEHPYQILTSSTALNGPLLSIGPSLERDFDLLGTILSSCQVFLQFVVLPFKFSPVRNSTILTGSIRVVTKWVFLKCHETDNITAMSFNQHRSDNQLESKYIKGCKNSQIIYLV